MKKFFLFIALGALAGCGSTDAKPQPSGETKADSPRTVVDSVFPVDEEIRRFKAARSGASVSELTGGAASRDELVGKFIAALEAHDTAVLAGLILNAAEFIDLYYPVSMYARPPYKQAPELRWFLMQASSNQGYARLLQRYGGEVTGFSSYTCGDTSRVESSIRLHDRCTITWSREPATMRAFSTIIELGGRYKFMSYANDL